MELKKTVDRVSAAQSELNSNLELIFAQQKDLESVLVQLEGEVEKLSMTADFTPQDRERERGYQMAEQMNAQLDHMANTLKDLVRRLNDAQSHGESSDSVRYLRLRKRQHCSDTILISSFVFVVFF